MNDNLTDAEELVHLAGEEGDESTLESVCSDLAGLDKQIADLEFQRMFSGEMDPNNAFLDIQAGSGGTEAQDWAEMLLRMYLRWGERRGFKTEIIEASAGEVAGIKSATVRIRRVPMPTAGCAPRPACTDWCASRRSIPATAGTPRSRRCSPRPRSRRQLRGGHQSRRT
jgi:hypothetical protein